MEVYNRKIPFLMLARWKFSSCHPSPFLYIMSNQIRNSSIHSPCIPSVAGDRWKCKSQYSTPLTPSHNHNKNSKPHPFYFLFFLFFSRRNLRPYLWRNLLPVYYVSNTLYFTSRDTCLLWVQPFINCACVGVCMWWVGGVFLVFSRWCKVPKCKEKI